MLDSLQVPIGGDFYLCGPAAFLRDLQEGLRARQVPAQRVYVEKFRYRTVNYSRRLRWGAAAASPAVQAGRQRSRRRFCAQWTHHALKFQIRQFAGAGGSMRGAGAMVVPYGRVPHLREPTAGWARELRSRAAGRARRRECPGVLCQADFRPRFGHVVARRLRWAVTAFHVGAWRGCGVRCEFDRCCASCARAQRGRANGTFHCSLRRSRSGAQAYGPGHIQPVCVGYRCALVIVA